MTTRRQTICALAAVPAAVSLSSLAAMAEASETEIGFALRRLMARDERIVDLGLATLSAHGDPDIVPGLITALRFATQRRAEIGTLLKDLTGTTEPDTWFDWMLWQERQEAIVPHAAFGPFKRDVFLSIDPNFANFLRPEHLARDRMKIRLEEITWGGVVKDGIPSLDFPEMIEADAADYLLDDDLVFGVAIEGDVRAYPLRIMGWHEMFNDRVGGVPVALAYCTLCGAGILFETQVDGRDEPLVFGSSGFLYRSHKLMFDRQTHSLWNQFTGKPVSGELVGSKIELKQRPVVISTWRDWQNQNPGTSVLSLETGHPRDYGSGLVYQDYFASPDLMFPAEVDESRLRQKGYVFGIRTFGAAKAWPVAAFEGGRVINDRVGDLNVVLIGDADGRTVRAYDRGHREFTFDGGELRVGVEQWRQAENALTGPDDEIAPRIAGHVAYWFAWDGYVGAASELYTK